MKSRRLLPLLFACMATLPLPAMADGYGPAHIAGLRATLADPHGRVMVAAHRGCWQDNAENSVAAIEACREMGGIDIVEFDVRRTADGHLVVMHDARVDRTTNGRGAVARLTLAELRRLRLRHGKGGARAALTDETVPTLAEALEAARGAMLVNVDLKVDALDDIAALFEQMGMLDQFVSGTGVSLPKRGAPVPDLFGTTQYKPVLKQRRLRASLVARWDRVAPLRPAAVEIRFGSEAWFRAGVRQIRGQGSRVLVNTMESKFAAGYTDARARRDPDRQWGRLLDLGANVIQTDEPARLLAYMATREASSVAHVPDEPEPVPTLNP